MDARIYECKQSNCRVLYLQTGVVLSCKLNRGFLNHLRGISFTHLFYEESDAFYKKIIKAHVCNMGGTLSHICWFFCKTYNHTVAI
jgi:hypothetical protein